MRAEHAGFPRLYAASMAEQAVTGAFRGFLRLYAAASLKHRANEALIARLPGVFCGFMPRPH